jgi:predicted component of type VI protein secretion system
MAKLIFIDSQFAGQVYQLVLEKTTIGRGDQNTLVIRDPSLSARHCEILFHGPEIIVRDLGSRNGTVVNGARLHHGQAQLRSGQTVRFGSVEARLELEVAPRSTSAPPDPSATEQTAVYAHRRTVREIEEAGSKAVPPAEAKLEASEPLTQTDQTVLLPTPPSPASPETAGSSRAAEVSETGVGKSWSGKLALLVLLGIAAIALAWWLGWLGARG